MLCNMFLYVVQHIFGQGQKVHIARGLEDFALSADSCRRLHKKHRYEIDYAPSPVRRKGGLAPLSCPRGNGAHGAPHPWDVLSTRTDLHCSSASGPKKIMPETLTSPGHQIRTIYEKKTTIRLHESMYPR